MIRSDSVHNGLTVLVVVELLPTTSDVSSQLKILASSLSDTPGKLTATLIHNRCGTLTISC